MSAVSPLPLYRLPPSHDVIVTASATDLAPALQELHDWLWKTGYTPLGPALLGWNEWAMREVRQPIAPTFAPISGGQYQIVERPALLVAATGIPLRDGKFNLAGVYDRVRQHGFDPLGAPLIPLGALPGGAATVQGFVPVVPRGTSGLIPLPGWYSAKMGWSPAAPEIGEPIPRWRPLQHTALRLLRICIGLILLGIVLCSIAALAGWLFGSGLYFVPNPNMVFSLISSISWGLEGLLVIGVIMLRQRLQAADRWNAFWAETPAPPWLRFELFDFELEE
jgi:hypothetical protein